MTIIPNARFELSAPGIVRWGAARLAFYLAVVATTGMLFVGGAAFYSYVWLAPTPSPQVVPSKLPAAPDPVSVDPDQSMKNIFSPGPVEPILLSRLTLQVVRKASVITIDDGRQFRTVGTIDEREAFAVGDDFVLKIISSSSAMHNDFALRTPSRFPMRASDLRWYTVRYSNEMRVFAVATEAQVNAAMARAIK